MPLAVDQTVQAQLNPASASGTLAKEQHGPVIRLESPQVDSSSGVTAIEQERTPEIPVEVESFLRKVESHQDQHPQEVVIADGSAPGVSSHHMAQPVIVLPITPAEEKAGLHKSPQFSLRWMVEWSHKIMKMFIGRVIYRAADEHLSAT